MYKKYQKFTIFLAFLLLFNPLATKAGEDLFYSSFVPNDEYYFNQWYLPRIESEKAWGEITKDSEIIIAIIDSGVQIDHPDLRENIWINKDETAGNNIDDDGNGYIDDINGWDFISNTNNPNPKFTPDFIEDEIAHGTIVAGIAAAKGHNREGVAGVAWDAKIMPLLVLDSRGVGELNDVISAIDYAIANRADIINLSFAGESYSPDLESAVRRAYKAGVLVVSAAGNNDEKVQGRDLNKNPMYPVCLDGYYAENMVFGVAATDALDQKTDFSGYGSKCIDISAPGVSIFSTSIYSPRTKGGEKVLDSYYDGYWSGTSMATPMVSAAAALVLANNPSLDRQELSDILKGSSDYIEKLNPEYIGMLGAGRLNIGEAVLMAKERLNKREYDIINTPNSGNLASEVIMSDAEGNTKSKIDVLGDFTGGVNAVVARTGTEKEEVLVVGAGIGGGPQIQIFTLEGKLLGQFFAYNKYFRGGVDIAVGDVDGDGVDDIVTGAGPGGGPHVRVFNFNGELLGQFFAYDKNFRGGVNVAVGDVNGDGVDDIVTGAGFGGGPQVRVFSKSGDLYSQFFAYDEKFRGGVNVSTADIDGGLRKYSEIITAPAGAGGPQIRVFDNDGKVISDFLAYDKKYKGEVNITSADIDKDGLDELITGAGPGGTAHVRVFEYDGELLKSYLAYDQNFTGGVKVGASVY